MFWFCCIFHLAYIKQLKSELEIFKERELSSLRLQMAATQRRELDATRKELQVGVTETKCSKGKAWKFVEN